MTERRVLNVEFLEKELSEKGKTGKEIKQDSDFIVTPKIATEQEAISMQLLERKPEGGLYHSERNVEILVENDPILNNYWPQLNDFNGQLEKHIRDVVFDSKTFDFEKEAPLWSDEDTDFIRKYINQYYKLRPRKLDLNMAILSVGRLCRYNPITQYLAVCYKYWDGIPRAEKLFIEFLGVEDDDAGYAREVTKKWLISAVISIFKPGTKPNKVLCLLNDCEISKSELLSNLVSPLYFSDSLDCTCLKDIIDNYIYKWIINIKSEEFEQQYSTPKTEQMMIKSLKSFEKAHNHPIRNSYCSVESKKMQHNAFVITTNKKINFYPYHSGNWDFWMLECGKTTPSKKIEEFTQEYRDQLWGEVVHLCISEGYLNNSYKALLLSKTSIDKATKDGLWFTDKY